MQWLYKGREGRIFEDDEIDDRLNEGWKDHPHEVLRTEERPADEDELAALRASAEILGIKVDGRWGKERLEKEIGDHSATTGNESVSSS